MNSEKAALLEVLAEIRRQAPEFSVDFIEELASVNEFQVALEILCDNVHELDVELPEVKLPGELKREIARLARCFRVDEKYWVDLA